MDGKLRVGRLRSDGSWNGAIGAYINRVVKDNELDNEGNEPEARRDAPGVETGKAIARTLRHLADVAKENGVEFVGELKDDHFREALRRRIAIASQDRRTRGEGVKRNTRANYKRILHAFGAFCRAKRAISGERWAAIEPIVRVNRGEEEHAQYLVIPFEQWPLMIASAAKRHLLDAVILGLGFFLMMRESEVSGLKWKHLDLDKRIARFRRNKDNGNFLENPIPDDLLSILLAWRAWMREQFNMEEIPGDWLVCASRERNSQKLWRNPGMDPSWPVQPTKQMQSASVRSAVKHAGKAIGYTHEQLLGQGIHLLRRSGAEHNFIESGGDYRLVAGLLGHGSPGKPNIEQTMRYLGHTNNMEKKREVVNKRSIFEPRLVAAKGPLAFDGDLRTAFDSLMVGVSKELAPVAGGVLVPSLDDVQDKPKPMALGSMSMDDLLKQIKSHQMYDELVRRHGAEKVLSQIVWKTAQFSLLQQLAIVTDAREKRDAAVEMMQDMAMVGA